MNISDVKINYKNFEGQDLLRVIFEKQSELMKEYNIPVINLDLPEHQQLIRATAWSVVEELGETIDAFNDHIERKIETRDHVFDEVADMAHFYLELLLMSGLTVDDVFIFEEMKLRPFTYLIDTFHAYIDQDFWDHDLETDIAEFIVTLSLSINVLKSRAWRQTNLKTDVKKYQDKLRETIPYFFYILWDLGIHPSELIDSYLRKNEVNLFRIRSKY